MKTILFYIPFTYRSRDVESVMLRLSVLGYKIISLNRVANSPFHAFLKEKNIETIDCPPLGNGSLFEAVRQVVFLIKTCYRKRVDYVFSHLESCNFVAAMAEPFLTAKVFVFRHHADLFAVAGRSPGFTYWLTYRLARNIIVVSYAAKKHMVEYEKIAKRKIQVIRLAYDFELYPAPDPKVIRGLQGDESMLILVTISQLIRTKRIERSIEVLRRLVAEGIDAKLFILGDGQLRDELMHSAAEEVAMNRVYFEGYVNNVPDYIAACSYILHPSESESSCVVLKEAGLFERPVIACTGVGDVDEYLKNESNSFLVDRTDFVNQAVRIIMATRHDRFRLRSMGAALHRQVESIFGIDTIIDDYKKLLN